MLQMFNNNLYTDFRTACNSRDLIKPKCHKTNHGCLAAETGQDQHMKLSHQSHISFLNLFWRENTVSLQALSPLVTHFFLTSPLFKIWDWTLFPTEGGRGWGACVGYFSIYFTHVKLPILKSSFCIHITEYSGCVSH